MNQYKIIISILIVSRNREELLNRNLKNITQQLINETFGWEVLVYDDASEKKTQKISLGHPNIRIYWGKHHIGLISARNYISSRVSETSKYLFYLDDDMFIHNLSTALKTSFQCLSSGFAAVSIPYINLPITPNTKVRRFKTIFSINKMPNKEMFFHGGCVIFKRNIFEKLGGFEGQYYFALEEEDLSLRLFVSGYAVKTIFGDNFSGIHDQPSGKKWDERYIYLLSNRLLFHYKFINNGIIRFILNCIYIFIYILKLKNQKKIKNAIKRYRDIKNNIIPERISSIKLLSFLIKRYFSV